MDWYPLALTTPTEPHVTGGTQIQDRLGRRDVPPGRLAETWEVSDVDGHVATVENGTLAGRTLRELTERHPDELVGRGWRGPCFPVLTKYIDATGMLPVHLHADDEAARQFEGKVNGKTEAWHILDAGVGATVLAGTKPGVDRATLREALLGERWDEVLRRLPIRAGDTVYVPGGTLHSFGPSTLIYEIEQTANIMQHAMTWNQEDGSPVPSDERERNIDKLLEEWRPEALPVARPPLAISVTDDIQRGICCAGPYFALERWTVANGARLDYRFDHATILSNAGAPVSVQSGSFTGRLEQAKSLLLPAALGHVAIEGPADLLIGYLPDLDRDIREPLSAAGYGAELIARLGDVPAT
ncbi:class I mannose-6-phosphate isomerase [Sphingomonas lacusdianchii]|jgi:mannose-6-phosphate isomerase|uniref:class I mannose-6-phosphate isomerase n=1 Tax=Sphingomonas lacusdianchii TaxID=2917992 RepID=UPI001F58781A|nr:class I mannose-6-phosphate isomerase [Sphingomonas sp. JXJ CY 53]